MASHKCHELVGRMLGFSQDAIATANQMIDFPENYPFLHELGIKHDDDRLWAMDIIRDSIREFYGQEGVWAVDIHYAIDYIDRWLDPNEAKKMLTIMGMQGFYPKNRKGFVDPIRRLWYPSYRQKTLPIASYCMKCKGRNKPINSPFCHECRVNIFELIDVNDIPSIFLLSMLRKKMEERRIDPYIKDLVEGSLHTLINEVIKDRSLRGLRSLNVTSP